VHANVYPLQARSRVFITIHDMLSAAVRYPFYLSLSLTLTHASMFAVACGACIDASNQTGVVRLCPNSPFPPQRSERTLRIESSLAAVARNCGTSSFIGPPRSVSAARHQLSTG